MSYETISKAAQANGFAFVIAVLAIIAVVYYFAKIEPRLKNIEDNQKEDSASNAFTAKVVENNTRAMSDMAESNKNTSDAIKLLSDQFEANNKANDKLWNFVINYKTSKGDEK